MDAADVRNIKKSGKRKKNSGVEMEQSRRQVTALFLKISTKRDEKVLTYKVNTIYKIKFLQYNDDIILGMEAIRGSVF